MRGFVGLLVAVLAACGDDDGQLREDAGGDANVDAPADAPVCIPLAAPNCGAPITPLPSTVNGQQCDPLTQTGCGAGEKCTWIVDSTSPQYVGHIGCAPDGTVNEGCACTVGPPGATGYDDCVHGTVCSLGTCKQICDNQGGAPMCDANHACTVYSTLFKTSDVSPPAAGVCDVGCNPLTENNFLGPTKPPTACRCAADQACYGFPSVGTPPVTAFTCTKVLSGSDALVHRSQVTGTVFVNSCAPGYLPLLRESSTVSTTICVALCKPLNCFVGNCGPGDANQVGAAPHRCNTTDARGTFAATEHCTFLWRQEIDSNTGNYLPSMFSNEVGYCFDHAKYLYDTNSDGQGDTPLPACKDLQDGFSSGTDPTNPTAYFGAADLGCVDTTHIQLAPAPRRRVNAFEDLRRPFAK